MYLQEKKIVKLKLKITFIKRKILTKPPQKLTVKCASLNMTDKGLCF